MAPLSSLSEEYAPRRIEPLGLTTLRGVRLKRYAIVYGPEAVDEGLMTTAETLAEDALGDLPGDHDDHGVGFLAVREGRGVNFMFMGLWTNENELRQFVWKGAGVESSGYAAVPFGGPTVCVWDLALMMKERDAWVEHVLRQPATPDVEAYLADQVGTAL